MTPKQGLSPATSTTLPHFEHLALGRAADLLEARGWNRLAERREGTGPLSVGGAIELAVHSMADEQPQLGKSTKCPPRCLFNTDAEALLVTRLYWALWAPRTTAEVSCCPDCTVCPEHQNDVLATANNAGHCDCDLCGYHAAFGMHPLHMANDQSSDEYIEDWEEHDVTTLQEVIAALRAAATPTEPKAKKSAAPVAGAGPTRRGLAAS
jgi:hypothetical protein